MGELKNFRLATEVHYLLKIKNLFLCPKRIPSARTKTDSVEPIASTFSLTIGNTLVIGRLRGLC